MNISIISDEISNHFETAVEIAKSWGITHFEIRKVYSSRIPEISQDAVLEVFDTIRHYGVVITALSPGLFKIPLHSPDLDYHRQILLPKAFTFAKSLGTDRVIVFAFLKPESKRTSQIPQLAVDILKYASDQAKKQGLTLLLENEHVCYADTGYNTAEIVEKVGSKTLKVNWDPCNAFSAGEQPYPAGYNCVKDCMINLHVKDAVRSYESGRTQYVVVGKGDIDWLGQLKALAKDRYGGYLCLETHFKPRVSKSKECLEGLRTLLKEAGR